VGAWCPKGRIAEDGPIDPKYPLKETSSPNYALRTEKNIREADGTLILTKGPANGGTALTIELAIELEKPHLIIDLYKKGNPIKVKEWGEKNKIEILNVAGPRESKVPGIHDKAVDFLKLIFSKIQLLH
jgi:hypothetical protein